MTHLLLFICGLLVLMLAAVDMLWTAFLEGAGPLTNYLYPRLGYMLRRVRLSTGLRVQRIAGLFVVLMSLTLWTSLVWLGWTLIFTSAPSAVINATTHRPADLCSRIYFTGYTIFTLGLGDYVPQGGVFKIATDLATGTGFVLFGLALAYLVPVINAATQKRQVALNIWCLGHSPADIIIRSWNGADTSALAPHFASLVSSLTLLAESHVTYPVLYFFFATRRSAAIGPNIAIIDEVITVLECGMADGCRLDLPSLGAVRQAITEYLETLRTTFVVKPTEAPPAPKLAELREAGIPVASDELFSKAIASLHERRTLLLALTVREGFTWTDVWPGR